MWLVCPLPFREELTLPFQLTAWRSVLKTPDYSKPSSFTSLQGLLGQLLGANSSQRADNRAESKQ